MTGKVVLSMIETNSKIHKPEIYNEAINDPIYSRRWRETIEEELQNLENYQTWAYKELLLKKRQLA